MSPRAGEWVLTKGNCIDLLALPFLATLLAGRPRLLVRAAFWLGVTVPLVIGGPWQLYSWTILEKSQSLDHSAIGPSQITPNQ